MVSIIVEKWNLNKLFLFLALPPPLSARKHSPPMPNATNGQRPATTMELMSKPNMPMMAMPRAILPKDRSTLDKMVEYLVGDGPNNRYALICRYCQCHNGKFDLLIIC